MLLWSFRIADCEVQSPFRAAWTIMGRSDRQGRRCTGSGWFTVVASPRGRPDMGAKFEIRGIGCKRSFSVFFKSVVRVKRG